MKNEDPSGLSLVDHLCPLSSQGGKFSFPLGGKFCIPSDTAEKAVITKKGDADGRG